jgi:hypothetical protein
MSPSPRTKAESKRAKESQTVWYLLWIVALLSVAAAFLKETIGGRRSSNSTTSATPRAQPQTEVSRVQPEIVFSFAPFNVMGTELFTSFMVTCPENLTGITRHNFGIPIYGNGKTFGVVLKNVKKGETYRVTVKANSIINESTVLAKIAQDDPYVVVLTPIRSDYSELAKTKQTVPVDFVFAVSKNGADPIEKSQRWTVHQINDCPISVTINTITPEGKIVPTRNKWPYTIAGFVNENHPWIESVLKDALQNGRCKSFSGYQRGEEEIDEQVEAIWDTLQKRGIKYSSITTSTVSGEHSFQHIRFMDESIRSTQANCADGSVLFASILRKIGLNTSIVLVPGHAYVAILSRDNTRYLYAIETTMLAEYPLRRAVESATIKQEFCLERVIKDESFERIEVNIAEVRGIGINPVPFMGNFEEPTPSQGQARITFDQSNYHNSIGMLTAAQFDDMMNRKLADKSQFQQPTVTRLDVTRRLANKMDEAKLQLQINPHSASNRSAWKDVIDEINKHRKAFNDIPKPQFKSGVPQNELNNINPMYEDSIRLLNVSDPSLGKQVSQFSDKDLQDSFVAAENALRALRVISVLPLDF